MRKTKHHPAPADAVASPATSVLAEPAIQAKLRQLLQLAKTQGHLSYDDLNEGLLNDLVDPVDIEAVMQHLRLLGVDIQDEPAQGDEDGESVSAGTSDSLADPERLYFRQLGKVPLLTREQEVEISKRIENAEVSVARQFHAFGVAAEAYQGLADKLRAGEERVDRIVLDHQTMSREHYLKNLAALCGKVTAFHEETTILFRRLSAKNPRAGKSWRRISR